jgi:oxalate decarboxylase
MSHIQRRDFLKGTAAFAAGVTAALTATRKAEAGDPSFMNNVPDPRPIAHFRKGEAPCQN